MDTRPSPLTEIEWPRLPRHWREKLVPAELPGLTREIVATILDQIPEYRRSVDGPTGKATRRGVEEALTTFVSQITQTGELSAAHLELFRGLGRGEALEGRGHDALQSAYRIGSKIAWRRIIKINELSPLPPSTVARLAAAVFGFVDHLAAISAEGFAEGQLQGIELDGLRRVRLLQLLLDQPATPAGAIAELAESLDWLLPTEIAMIEVGQAERLADRELVDLARAGFGSAALAGRVAAGVVIAVPGTPDSSNELEPLVKACDVTLRIGCTVPLVQAATSARWAQLAERLVRAEVLPAAPVTWCADHLPQLLLHSEPALHAQLVHRRLGPLVELSDAKRLKYARLLSAWLEYGCTQAELAAILQVHRQTVHYQFARLTAMFGDQLRDRTARVELLLALRAALPEWETSAD